MDILNGLNKRRENRDRERTRSTNQHTDDLSPFDLIDLDDSEAEKEKNPDIGEKESVIQSSEEQAEKQDFRMPEEPDTRHFEKKDKEEKEESETFRRMLDTRIRNQKEEGQTTVKQQILIGIVIDATISFAVVYPKVFYLLVNLLKAIQKAKQEYKGVEIMYGLTVLNDSPRSVLFSSGEYFTSSEEEFEKTLRQIRFEGGSPDGRENLGEALDRALFSLNHYGSESAYRGILMFSDSLPQEEDCSPDFYSADQNGYINRGVRFADFYTYTNDFVPEMRPVDRYNHPVQNEKNVAAYRSLKDLLDGDMESILQKTQKMVVTMLNQASIR